MKRKLFSSLAALCLVTIGVFLWHSHLSSASFNANNLMDDNVFDKADSMSAAQIDAWLNSNFPTSCISTNNGFSSPDPTGYSPSTGFTYGGNVSAGTVIAHAAYAYGINPQVILATLQKESSVVSGDASYHCQYINTSMGYDCPDSGSCPRNPATESGFSKQIIHAAWVLRFHEQRSKGNVGWQETKPGWNNSDDPQSCYSGKMTQGTYQICPSGPSAFYDGWYTIDATAVHMDTGATAALYDYTPHFHGNQNFDAIFQAWFGSTTNNALAWSLIAGPSDGKLYLVVGQTRYWIPGPAFCTAWGLDCSSYTQASTFYFSSLSSGPDLSYVALDINGNRYLMSNGVKYLLPSDQYVLAWGVAGIPHIWAPGVVAQAADGGNIGRFGVSTTSGTVYLMNGTAKHPGLTAQSLSYWGYSSGTATTVTDDLLTRMTTGPALDRYVNVNGQNEIIDKGNVYQFGNAAMENGWGSHSYVSVASYATDIMPKAAVGTFIRADNDAKWYYLESGNKHYIGTAGIANIWGWGNSNPLTVISPELLAAFSTGVDLGYLAYSTTSGNHYIVDGAKHWIPGPGVAPLYEGAQSVPGFSDASLSLLPSGADANLDVVGFAGDPRVFALDDGTLRYIPDLNTLDAFGGYKYPILSFGSSLDGLLPIGTDASPVVKDGSGNTYYLENGSKYSLSTSFASTWQTTGAPVFNTTTLAIFASTGQTLKQAVSVNGRRFVINNRTMVDVTGDYQNYGLSTGDFIGITRTYFPTVGSSHLVGTAGNDKIWLLSMGQRYHILDFGMLLDLGYGSNAGILSLNSDIIATLPEASSTANHLIRAPDSGVIFAMHGSGYGFQDSATLDAYCGSCGVLIEPSSVFQKFNFSGWVSRLVYGTDGKIYYMDNGQRQWMANPSLLNTRYAGIPWMSMPQYTIDSLPTGSTILN